MINAEQERTLKKKGEELESKIEIVSTQEQEVERKKEIVITHEQDIAKREAHLQKNTELYKFLDDISLSVKDYNNSFSVLEDRFKNETSLSIQTRFNNFIRGAKKLIGGLAYELTKYKKAFSNFWKHGSKEFRSLAQELEDNKCRNYEEYYESKARGELISQREKKNHSYRGMEY